MTKNKDKTDIDVWKFMSQALPWIKSKPEPIIILDKDILEQCYNILVPDYLSCPDILKKMSPSFDQLLNYTRYDMANRYLTFQMNQKKHFVRAKRVNGCFEYSSRDGTLRHSDLYEMVLMMAGSQICDRHDVLDHVILGRHSLRYWQRRYIISSISKRLYDLKGVHSVMLGLEKTDFEIHIHPQEQEYFEKEYRHVMKDSCLHVRFVRQPRFRME